MEFIYLFIFILGLCVGSFLNVVILRLQTGEKIVVGRSHCPKCKKELSWLENIPLFSFIMLQGKCKGCKKRISWQYPIVELLTGILFLVPLFFSTSIFLLIYYWIIICFLIIIFVYDFKYYVILNKVVWPAIIFVFLAQGCLWLLKNNFSYSLPASSAGGLIAHYSLFIFSAIIISGFFLCQYLISKGRWIGGGDIRLGFLMGLILGWPNCLVALFLAYILGLIVSLPLLFLGKKKMNSQIPLGTLLSLATLITLFFGQQILTWYLKLIYA